MAKIANKIGLGDRYKSSKGSSTETTGQQMWKLYERMMNAPKYDRSPKPTPKYDRSNG